MTTSQREQLAALLNAIAHAKLEDLDEWRRIANHLRKRLTPAQRRAFTEKLTLAACRNEPGRNARHPQPAAKGEQRDAGQ